MRLLLPFLVVLCLGIGILAADAPPAWTPPADVPSVRYVGAEKCKNCHQAEAAGNQYAKWSSLDMAHAWERLGTDKARETAKARGIADPQVAPECLKCHTTGYGLPPERFAKGFDVKQGVQCEACHGPGERHMKARMAAAFEEEEAPEGPQAIPAGEIQRPTAATCLGCHNEESPGFQPFCFKRYFEKIGHLDPRRKRTEADLAAYACGCGDTCTCRGAECGGTAVGRGTGGGK